MYRSTSVLKALSRLSINQQSFSTVMSQYSKRLSVCHSSKPFISGSSSSLGAPSCQVTRNKHTDGDYIMANFMEREIENETEDTGFEGINFPKWVVDTNGSKCKITKFHEEEKIVVRWNVNLAAVCGDDVDFNDLNYNPDLHLNLVCKPSFTVYISKDLGKTSLALHCSFPQHPDVLDFGKRNDLDIVDLSEFSIVEGMGEHEDEKNAKKTRKLSDSSTFTIDSSTLDPELYSGLIKMLCERGLDEKFMMIMRSFSKEYEQKLYIKYLKGLENWARMHVNMPR